MIICSCHSVTENQIRSAIEDGAGSVEAVGRSCRAGTDCGSCREQVAAMIEGGETDQLIRLGRCGAKVPARAA